MNTEPWTIYCDGSAVPNPGRMGLGAVVTAPDGSRHPLSITAEGRGCNNEAELRALMAAMQYAVQRGATALLVHCDNSVVVQQLEGTATEPFLRLAPLFDEVRAVLRSFASARLVWIPRHRNQEADALARAAVGLMPKKAARTARRRR
ncbi:MULTISPECIES: ribonuclease HI family protein [unclassified Polaromonas]|uniref:ribonuclease HI family protein n=1 Tax=unclassified Polaromonas TaxID=2638319 RepID=UPI000F090361|nr:MULTISPECIES: ribonuclease HI family protein [unclassified Polaromonas]AYQ27685.1 ribonuclease H [Polaromonas sp. SP1]QGJ17466.1 reverse transcriptase-like protein [Polaromonas sp. Pch-P]